MPKQLIEKAQAAITKIRGMNPSHLVAVRVYNAETLVANAIWNLKEGNLVRAKLYAGRALKEAESVLETLRQR